MVKKSKEAKRSDKPSAGHVQAGAQVISDDDHRAAVPKMKKKAYEKQMRLLHGELVALQEWVKATGAKVCIVFEGRDTAGKGGTIKRITERVSPRVFRVVALSAPTDREKSQMYVQRYVTHFPAAGEVVVFDRSLVQPGRSRAGHGIHARIRSPDSWKWPRRSRRRWSSPASS